MVARVYLAGGIYAGRVVWVESYSNGWATVIVRDLGGYLAYKVPYAAIEIEAN